MQYTNVKEFQNDIKKRYFTGEYFPRRKNLRRCPQKALSKDRKTGMNRTMLKRSKLTIFKATNQCLIPQEYRYLHQHCLASSRTAIAEWSNTVPKR